VGAVVTPGLKGVRGWSALPEASTLCGACRDVCPLRLDIPRMLLGLRSRASVEAPPAFPLRFGMRAFAWAAARPAAYRLMTRLGRTLLRARARDGWIARLPGMAGGWTRFRDLRAPAPRTFQDAWRERGRVSPR
jgi:L-lactate dehydrogenase complex protein LldF